MRRAIGVDFGTVRVGVAVSDPIGVTAQPLTVLPRARAVEEITGLVEEYDAGVIVVGLPVTLGGAEGDSARAARDLGEELGRRTGVEIVYRDERFTSRIATQLMLEGKARRSVRRAKSDKVAAALLLQDYLDGTK